MAFTTPSGARWRAAAAAVAVLLALLAGWLLLRQEQPRAGSVGGQSAPRAAPTPLAAELAEPAIEDARGAAPEAVPPAAELPPARRGLRFVYDDGTPAAGIGLYPARVRSARAGSRIEYTVPALRVLAQDAAGQTVGVPLELRSFPFALDLRPGSPQWSIHTDGEGGVDAPAAETLAPIAAARLSRDALVLLPVDLERSAAHVLPAVVPQEILLDGADAAEAVAVEVLLSSADLFAFLHQEEDERLPAEDFADHALALAQALDSARVVARRALRLTPADALARLDLPRGKYELAVRTCTFGWWARGQTFEAGAPVVLSLYRPPVAQISCFDPRTDELKAPKEVRFYQTFDPREPGDASGSAELDVPWELRGTDIFVAVIYDDPLPDHRYAIKVTWSTGEERLTSLLHLESLQGLLHLTD